MSRIKAMFLIKIKALEGVPKFSCSGNLMIPRVKYCWRWRSVSKGMFCALQLVGSDRVQDLLCQQQTQQKQTTKEKVMKD